MNRLAVQGPRIRLLPFAERFLTQRYVDWLNDPDLMRFSEQRHRRHTMASNAEYVRSFDQPNRYLWAIIDRDDELHVGNVNAYVDANNGVADIGLLIGERGRQGRGLGAEAWMGAIHALFLGAGVRKITGGCAALNLAMIRIMQSAGMVEDGTRRAHVVIDGIAVDVVHRALFRDSFRHDKRFTVTSGSLSL
jgi:Acetyltransferases, including N-acetylases of ribosomal proteins